MARFYAVFKVVTEKHIKIEADNWQDAARIANEMERPVLSDTGTLEVVTLIEDDDLDEDAICYYDSEHELVGPCNKCGRQILERSCASEVCKSLHTEGKGSWVSTEHGHVTWCSQECRDADKANDPEVEILDRLSGV